MRPSKNVIAGSAQSNVFSDKKSVVITPNEIPSMRPMRRAFAGSIRRNSTSVLFSSRGECFHGGRIFLLLGVERYLRVEGSLNSFYLSN